MHDCSRDRGALLFAAAELMRKMIRAFGQPNKRENFACPISRRIARSLLQQEREHHVLQRRHRRQQIEELKNNSELIAPVSRQRLFIDLMQRQAVDKNFTRSGPIDSREQMHKRALAATARPTQRHEFVSRNIERNAVHRSHLAAVAAIMPMHVDE